MLRPMLKANFKNETKLDKWTLRQTCTNGHPVVQVGTSLSQLGEKSENIDCNNNETQKMIELVNESNETNLYKMALYDLSWDNTQFLTFFFILKSKIIKLLKL